MQISPISFTQKYISSIKTTNLRTNKPDNLNFVMYEDDNNDKEKLKRQTETKFEGLEGAYANCIYNDFCDNMVYRNPDIKFWGIEDKDGNIQALMETASNVEGIYDSRIADKKGLEVSLMCVNSQNSFMADDRKYKRLGVQLVSGAVRQAVNEDSDFIILQNAEDGFWETIPCFKDYDYGAVKILDKRHFKNCANQLDKMV